MKQTFIEFLQEGDVIPFPKKHKRLIDQDHRSGGLSSITDEDVDELFDKARVQNHYSFIHKEAGGLHIEIGFSPHTRYSIHELEDIATEVMTDEYPIRPYKVENEGDVDDLVVHLHYKL